MKPLPFRDDTIPHALIDNNTESVFRYVEYSAGSSVVGFVWHTFLNGTITLKINQHRQYTN